MVPHQARRLEFLLDRADSETRATGFRARQLGHLRRRADGLREAVRQRIAAAQGAIADTEDALALQTLKLNQAKALEDATTNDLREETEALAWRRREWARQLEEGRAEAKEREELDAVAARARAKREKARTNCFAMPPAQVRETPSVWGSCC